MKRPIGKQCTGQINRHITVNECRLILKYFADRKDARAYLLFFIQLGLGLRISETVAINISDFTTDLSLLSVRLSKTDKIRERYVPVLLRRMIWLYVKDYTKEIYRHNGYLFYTTSPNAKQSHISGLVAWQIIRQAVASIGINDRITPEQTGFKRAAYRIGTHSLRRMNTTQLLRQTDSVPFVAYWRGDGDYDMVMRYNDQRQFMERERAEAEELISSFMEPPEHAPRTENLKRIVRQEIKEILKKI